jgi:hypothetical protein
MEIRQAHVKNGQLVLDEPTTKLPEGKVVRIMVLDEDEDDDGLTDKQRAALHRSLERGIAQSKAGQSIDGEEFLARIREHRT